MPKTQTRIQLDRTKLLGFRLDATPTQTHSQGKMGAKFGNKIGGKSGTKPAAGSPR